MVESCTTEINRCRKEQLRCLEELRGEISESERKGIKLGISDWIFEEGLIIHEHTKREVSTKHSGHV